MEISLKTVNHTDIAALRVMTAAYWRELMPHSPIVQDASELLSLLWNNGILMIDLNVRTDNPIALKFWRAQGFEIALHRLRLYRNTDQENSA